MNKGEKAGVIYTLWIVWTDRTEPVTVVRHDGLKVTAWFRTREAAIMASDVIESIITSSTFRCVEIRREGA